MFLRLQTQWNVIDGGFIGLKYESVRFAFTIWDVPNPRVMLEDLQVMEFAALQVLNERSH